MCLQSKKTSGTGASDGHGAIVRQDQSLVEEHTVFRHE